jgi:hypothetical protein
MVIFLNTFPDVGVQPSGLFLVGFLSGLGLVDDARALRTRHYGGVVVGKFEVPVIVLSSARRCRVK